MKYLGTLWTNHDQTISMVCGNGYAIKDCPIVVLGLTFKEDCSDLRNSRVIDVIRELESYGARVVVHDPVAESREALHEYGVDLVPWEQLPKAAAIVAAVGHAEFKTRSTRNVIAKLQPGGVIADVKSMLDAKAFAAEGITIWRL